MTAQHATSAPPASTALAIAGSAQLAPGNENIAVSAFTPPEMVESNNRLIEWFAHKIIAQKAEAAELRAAADHATKQKWKNVTLKKHATLAEKRVIYFEKIKLALEAGYYIVPNFPVVCFAIRTNKVAPSGFKQVTCSYRPGYNHQQDLEALPAGEGEYKNPFPLVDEWVDSEEGGKKNWSSSASYYEDIEFPVNMAKFEIMEATTRAMQLQIFDAMGVLPGKAKKDDPMIIARIRDPRPRYSVHDDFRGVSFIVGWAFDTKIL